MQSPVTCGRSLKISDRSQPVTEIFSVMRMSLCGAVLPSKSTVTVSMSLMLQPSGASNLLDSRGNFRAMNFSRKAFKQDVRVIVLENTPDINSDI